MKVAVIYTGALRTIEKSIKYLKQNVLLNDDVHVFAYLENDSSKSNSEWESWLHNELGDNLKYLTLGTVRQDSTFLNLRERMLSLINTTDNWKIYLRESGSIVEHYQLWLVNQVLANYEDVNKFKYDYVIRYRPDTILAKPIDFNWLNFSLEEIQERLSLIREYIKLNNIECNENMIFYYFMCTIYNKELISNIKDMECNERFDNLDSIPKTPEEIKQFVENGRYILTMRDNLLWIIKRDYFSLIPCTGVLFGTLRYPVKDPIWFNSEHQFKAACYHSKLAIFNYSTGFENKSLYRFDKNDYFDDDYNLKVNNILYCIIRQ